MAYFAKINREHIVVAVPFPSWHLDKTTYTWKSPAGDVPETFDDGLVQKDGSTPLGDLYHWNELKKIWDKT